MQCFRKIGMGSIISYKEHSQLYCDGEKNCQDGSDEANCYIYEGSIKQSFLY